MNRAISVNIPHELGRAEARRRIDDGFGGFARHLGVAAGALTKTWSGDRLSFSLSALGQSISGTVDVEDRVVRLEVLLPALLAMMAGKLKARLQSEGQLLLESKPQANKPG